MLNVGDMVKVRADLECKSYGGVGVVPPMLKNRGKIMRIASMRATRNHITIYRLKEDTDGWNWTEEMFGYANTELMKIRDKIIGGE